MKELPILFNGRSVQSLIAKKKTETRRPIKPQPDFCESPRWGYAEKKKDGHSGIGWYCCEDDYPDEGSYYYGDPYGPPGTILWVRESVVVQDIKYEGSRPVQLKVKYAADRTIGVVEYPSRLRGKPTIGHYLAYGCYREAQRIRLKVVKKFPQKLRNMTDKDAIAEGYPEWECAALVSGQDVGIVDWQTPREEYFSSWDKINPKFLSKDSPWVWVVRFELISVVDLPKDWW